jgi:hypothetical protein
MKNINPRILPYMLIVILLAYCVIGTMKCNENSRLAVSNKGLYDYEHSRLDTLLNKQGLKVTETKPAETYSADDIKKLSAEVFDLKKSNERQIKEVAALVRVNQGVKIKGDSVIKYYPVVMDDVDSMVSIHECVLPPRKFSNENKNYSIAGTVLLDGVKIDSIELNNTVSFRIAEKKNGLFSPRETVVQAINSNPYFTNTGMQSIVLKPKPSAWNKWIKPIVIGAASLIIKNQLQ